MAPSQPTAIGRHASSRDRRRVIGVVSVGGRPICERCLAADGFTLRLRGLLGRDELPSGDGIWIRPATSIHMFFMRFPIDAVFLDRDGTVVKLVEGLKPWRLATCRGARSVIELAHGEILRRQLELGDHVGGLEVDAAALAA
jgi:uncharacterized membrane protein (UPF0127 family)